MVQKLFLLPEKKGGVIVVGINDEEEIRAEQLKHNSFEAQRMRDYAKSSQQMNGNVHTTPGAPPVRNSASNLQRGNTPPRRNAAPPSMNAHSRTGGSAVNRNNITQGRSDLNRSGYQTRSGSLRPVQNRGTTSSRTYTREPNVKPQQNIKKKKDKASIAIKILTTFVILLTIGISMYALVIFGDVPFITKWRNIWIETAMTTDQHKWLATTFFPESLIKEVMDAQVDIRDIGKTDILKEEEEDILGQKNLVVGEKDSHGNEVLINDIEQGIVVLKVVTSNYVGRLVLIDDPSRVYISATDYKNSRGQFICDYLEKEDAVIGMNASGFHDPGGTSVGGVVTAQCIAQGEYWGSYSSKYITVGFDKDDRLVVGEFSNWDDYNLRDAFQYHPALIINGEKVIEGSSGWGLQPRTVIGQAKNGVVMFFVVDGRQVGYSLGATMGDCADVLEEYGAVNAGACDGGSSSVLAYEGEILNEPSTNMPTGRYLPNAWVVARKTTD